MYSSKRLNIFVIIALVIVSNTLATPVPEDNKAENNIDSKAASPSPKCASSASASSASSSCFSSDTLVTLANRQQIPIGQLRSGHQILTIHGTTIVSTEMMMMLDQNKISSAMFHTITTISGHKVSLTAFHLLATVTKDDEIKYKLAKDIKEDDILRVVINDKIYLSPVNNITMEMKTGFYAPLTMTGTFLANNVDASCFSNVENHDMVQFYLKPLRWYYEISRLLSIEQPFGDSTVDGIHYVPKMLYEMVQFIYPSILRLS